MMLWTGRGGLTYIDTEPLVVAAMEQWKLLR